MNASPSVVFKGDMMSGCKPLYMYVHGVVSIVEVCFYEIMGKLCLEGIYFEVYVHDAAHHFHNVVIFVPDPIRNQIPPWRCCCNDLRRTLPHSHTGPASKKGCICGESPETASKNEVGSESENQQKSLESDDAQVANTSPRSLPLVP